MRDYFNNKESEIQTYLAQFSKQTNLTCEFLTLKFKNYFYAVREEINYDFYEYLRQQDLAFNHIESIEQQVTDKISGLELKLEESANTQELVEKEKLIKELQKIILSMIAYYEKREDTMHQGFISYLSEVYRENEVHRESEEYTRQIKRHKIRIKDALDKLKSDTVRNQYQKIKMNIQNNNYAQARSMTKFDSYLADLKNKAYEANLKGFIEQANGYAKQLIAAYRDNLPGDMDTSEKEEIHPTQQEVIQEIESKPQFKELLIEKITITLENGETPDFYMYELEKELGAEVIEQLHYLINKKYCR